MTGSSQQFRSGLNHDPSIHGHSAYMVGSSTLKTSFAAAKSADYGMADKLNPELASKFRDIMDMHDAYYVREVLNY